MECIYADKCTKIIIINAQFDNKWSPYLIIDILGLTGFQIHLGLLSFQY